ncbi:oxygenase MpaB family protein [uncultured Corynebacterium sp.]|uniref:oxygenase MpaB family protein n=1 Tax=uncultured Corynebacterium sp. TaxID=159447 RepID=UPI00259B58BA|nr:oxygenase MpaB family protein [uncultured Corynebacterium sp.]
MTTLKPSGSTAPAPATTAASEIDTANLPELGPDSILWQRFGDWRSMFVALSAGVLQIAQRDISRSLVQQSNVFDNEVARLVRSAFPIIRTVYEGPEVGAMIRDFHKDIKGTHPDGTRYHSLNPEVYYWAHATFTAMPYCLAGNFMPELSRVEREQLFQESRTWYSYYGVAEPENAPKTYDEYVKYMDAMYDKLGPSETIDRSRIMNGLTLDPPDPSVPRWAWKPVAPFASKLLLWVSIGLLPAKVRDNLGLEWTSSDQRKLNIFARATRGVFSVLPRKARMVPMASRAIEKAEAQGR